MDRGDGSLMREDSAADSDSSSGSSGDPSLSEGDEEELSWIAWFCTLKGNEFFVEVDEEYIQDDFNLSGLSSSVPYYEYALDCILDVEGGAEVLSESQAEVVESAAEVLYGLIHARFVLTARGLAALAHKFRQGCYERCPRVLCEGQPCLPVGLSDTPRVATVKLYCPRCRDVFQPRSRRSGALDGAFFTTTAPHLLMMTHPSLRPEPVPTSYVPKIWGFRVHRSALAPPGWVDPAASQGAQGASPATPPPTSNGGGAAGTAAAAAAAAHASTPPAASAAAQAAPVQGAANPSPGPGASAQASADGADGAEPSEVMPQALDEGPEASAVDALHEASGGTATAG